MPEGKVWLEGGSRGGSGGGHYRLSSLFVEGKRENVRLQEGRIGEERRRGGEKREEEGPSKGAGEAGERLRERKPGKTAAVSG